MEGRPERLSRLLVALAIPLVGLAALAVAVALTHKAARTTPAPAPPPQPVAVPTPTVLPALLVGTDDFTLIGPRAYGTVSSGPLAPIQPQYSFDVTPAAIPVGLPDALPVWRLAPGHLDAQAVAAPFGLAGVPSATPLSGNLAQWYAGLTVDTAQDIVSWYSRDSTNPRLGGFPRDPASAVSLAARWLDHAGLAPPTAAHATVEQTSNGEGAAFAEWAITWTRTATGYPRWPIDITFARVSADGTLKQLDLSRPVVAGGSLYPLRRWQDALADARHGRWSRLFAPLPEFTTPSVVHTTVSISIVYAQGSNANGSYAVPMYSFTEAGSQQPGLVPALAP